MKRVYTVLLVIVCISLMSFKDVKAQDNVNFSVTFGWDDSNCSCSEPLTKEVRVIITNYPGGGTVHDSEWYTPSSNPETYNGNDNINTDCESPCYTVSMYVRYEDNTGICCSCSASANVTGQQLVSGYTLPYTIVMN